MGLKIGLKDIMKYARRWVLKVINRYLLLLTTLFMSLYSYANEIPTPIKTEGGYLIEIKEQDSEYYPLILSISKNGNLKKVDEYSYEGGTPIVDSMKIVNLDNSNNLVVLVYWNVANPELRGTVYKTYVYTLENDVLSINKKITNDNNLEGFEGLYNEGEGGNGQYQLKELPEVEEYLLSKYSQSSKKTSKLSMCNEGTEEVFSCTLENNKQVSLCALGSSFIYRYGTPDNIELEYPNDGEKPLDWRLIQGPSLKQEVFFNRGKYNYALSYSMDVVDLLSAEFQDTYALDVEHNGKSIFSRTCKEVSKPFPPHFGASFQ
ncbi:hypothetical protein [Vibrio coralliilyticus]|uniref:hypothetical protein n=1 Tax=Vibrio coralliilyticus TaxID=190893 RepID=UPI002FD718F0